MLSHAGGSGDGVPVAPRSSGGSDKHVPHVDAKELCADLGRSYTGPWSVIAVDSRGYAFVAWAGLATTDLGERPDRSKRSRVGVAAGGSPLA